MPQDVKDLQVAIQLLHAGWVTATAVKSHITSAAFAILLWSVLSSAKRSSRTSTGNLNTRKNMSKLLIGNLILKYLAYSTLILIFKVHTG